MVVASPLVGLVLSSPRPLVLSSSSYCAALSSSRRPLPAPPSRPLIAQAGCCVASRCATVSSSRPAALLSSRRPLVAPPSCRLIAPSGCCVASRRARHPVLTSSSHYCATMSSSCCAVWLFCGCLSLAPPSFPLVALPSCLLNSPALPIAKKKEAPPTPPPPAYQRQHQYENVYKSRQLGLI